MKKCTSKGKKHTFNILSRERIRMDGTPSLRHTEKTAVKIQITRIFANPFHKNFILKSSYYIEDVN